MLTQFFAGFLALLVSLAAQARRLFGTPKTGAAADAAIISPNVVTNFHKLMAEANAARRMAKGNRAERRAVRSRYVRHRTHCRPLQRWDAETQSFIDAPRLRRSRQAVPLTPFERIMRRIKFRELKAALYNCKMVRRSFNQQAKNERRAERRRLAERLLASFKESSPIGRALTVKGPGRIFMRDASGETVLLGVCGDATFTPAPLRAGL